MLARTRGEEVRAALVAAGLGVIRIRGRVKIKRYSLPRVITQFVADPLNDSGLFLTVTLQTHLVTAALRSDRAFAARGFASPRAPRPTAALCAVPVDRPMALRNVPRKQYSLVERQSVSVSGASSPQVPQSRRPHQPTWMTWRRGKLSVTKC